MMKGKKFIGIALLILITVFGNFSVSRADTVLIPVIAVNQPNTVTIVSVFSLTGYNSTHLKYIYRYKDAFTGTPATSNHTGICSTKTIIRPTFDSDLVSFDASGVLNSGNALFNDSNSYGGSFDLGLTGAKRAYLLVTHSDVSGNRVDLGGAFGDESLGAEAVIMDIGSGAAWGLRGVNEAHEEDYDFTISGVETVFGSFGKAFSFFPTNEWTTKFFITPIGDNMDTANLTGKVSLFDGGTILNPGLVTRDGTTQSFAGITIDFTCTAGVSLTEMLDSSLLSAVENKGGWAFLHHLSVPPTTPSANPLIVYKLEFVVNNSTYGGTNNNGTLLSNRDGRSF